MGFQWTGRGILSFCAGPLIRGARVCDPGASSEDGDVTFGARPFVVATRCGSQRRAPFKALAGALDRARFGCQR